MLIFPEGTRSKNYHNRLPFKKGVIHIALQTGLPIVPVGQYGMHKVESTRSIIYKKGSIYFNVGKAIETKDWKKESLNDYLSKLESSVEESILQAKSSER